MMGLHNWRTLGARGGYDLAIRLAKVDVGWEGAALGWVSREMGLKDRREVGRWGGGGMLWVEKGMGCGGGCGFSVAGNEIGELVRWVRLYVEFFRCC